MTSGYCVQGLNWNKMTNCLKISFITALKQAKISKWQSGLSFSNELKVSAKHIHKILQKKIKLLHKNKLCA